MRMDKEIQRALVLLRDDIDKLTNSDEYTMSPESVLSIVDDLMDILLQACEGSDDADL